MNHEVRTPLNGVLGVAGVLASTRLDDRQREMVAVIEDSGTSLQRILNDVLDMVELGSGQMALADQPFDLGGLAAALAKSTAIAAQAKSLTFRTEGDDLANRWVVGDAKRLDQILANLLSNAVKFTDVGGVTLAISGKDEAGVWRFDVRDTGVGFDPSNVEEMFQAFSQADGSMTRRFGGTGLGLCLAREMARAMGGDITADGAPGAGAVFVLTLPLVELDAPTGLATTGVTLDSVQQTVKDEEAPVRILLADDNANNRMVIEMILGAVGADILSVEDGALAVEAFKDQAFDAVLMDLQMPVMDGLTAIRLIRDHEGQMGRTRTPIIVVSANVQSEHVKASAAAGADGHLPKPILAPTLLAALDVALSGAPPGEPVRANA
jgi:CheY-like chemotaxis protein